ncbi:Uncharacterised protein [uncultured archaeon]|nr:Uncharacterised protein [uncultured archaeon]
MKTKTPGRETGGAPGEALRTDGAGFLGLSRRWLYAGLALTVLLLLPLVYFQYLPLNDWPNHLASMHLLIEQQAGIGTYIGPNPNLLLPNSSAFWAMRLLGPRIGVESAGRLMLGLTVVLTIWGMAYFFRSVDKRLAPLGLALGAALAYNWFFLMGFLNYALALPLFLLAGGGWMERREKRMDGKGVMLALILSVLASFTHLVAGLALLALIGWMRVAELAQEWREKKGPDLASIRARLTHDWPFVLPVLLMGALAAQPLLSGEGNSGAIEWGSLFGKLLYGVLGTAVPILAVVFAIVAACYLALRLGQLKNGWRPDWMWLGLGLLMLAGALFLPENTASWQFAAPRLWPFVYYFMALAIFAPLARTQEGSGVVSEMAAALMLLALLQGAVMAHDWQGLQLNLAQVAAVGAQLPAQASVLPLGEGFAQAGPEPAVSPYYHAWGYWVMQKDVYVPYLFAWNYSPIQYNEPDAHGREQIGSWMERLAAKNFASPPNSTCQYWGEYYQQFNWSLVGSEYQYVVLRAGECENGSLVPPPFERIWNEGNLSIFKNREKE